MSLAQMIHKRPAVGVGIAVTLLVAAAAVLIWQMGAMSRPAAVSQAFYTTDDGKTWFADSLSRIPPFDHDGRTAVRVYLFSCRGGKPFVGYLERFDQPTKARLDRALQPLTTDPHSQAYADQQALIVDAMNKGTEVKQPGGTKWYPAVSAPPEAVAIPCPEGCSREDLELYHP